MLYDDKFWYSCELFKIYLNPIFIIKINEFALTLRIVSKDDLRTKNK